MPPASNSKTINSISSLVSNEGSRAYKYIHLSGFNSLRCTSDVSKCKFKNCLLKPTCFSWKKPTCWWYEFQSCSIWVSTCICCLHSKSSEALRLLPCSLVLEMGGRTRAHWVTQCHVPDFCVVGVSPYTNGTSSGFTRHLCPNHGPAQSTAAPRAVLPP